MRKTFHRFYPLWSHDKEERWLSTMSRDGWSLVSVSYMSYVFEKGTPGEYTVRLEMLEDYPGNPKSRDYIELVESTGAEYLGSMMRWVYFRKKSSSGEFTLFSDNTSRLKHLNRVLGLLAIILFVFVSLNLSSIHRFGQSTFFTLWSLFVLVLALVLAYGLVRILMERKRLQKEAALFD